MIEGALILLLVLGLFWFLNPWSTNGRRRKRPLSQKAYWQDGHGY